MTTRDDDTLAGLLARPARKEAPRKASAILRRAALRQQRALVERLTAWLVLALSIAGTVVALHGGWAPVLAGKFTIAATLGGLLLQGALTWMEWSYGDDKRSLPYLAALAGDTGMTIIGYAPLLVPPLTAWLTTKALPAPMPLAGAWGAVVLAAFLIAWYPDDRLID